MAKRTDTEPRQVPFLEGWFEWLIFQSRWVMAPFYFGLIAALFVPARSAIARMLVPS